MYQINVVGQWRPGDEKNVEKFVPLLKSVLGYTDGEINRMIEKQFSLYAIALNLTKEQVRLAFQPFYDIDAPMYISRLDDITGEILEVGVNEESLGLVKQAPKDHYYDEPVISREHLCDPDYVRPPRNDIYDIKVNKPTSVVTCPYCQSTRVSRISIYRRMVSIGFWGLASSKFGKQWECWDCGSEF